MPNRFQDKNLVLYDFINEIQIICPECNRKAIIKNDTETYKSTVICSDCNYTYTSDNKVIELSLKANCNNCGVKITYEQRVNEKKDQLTLRCPSCNTSHKFEPKVSEYYSFQEIFDKYDLWYSENFKGHHFWAYNTDHLEYIENYKVFKELSKKLVLASIAEIRETGFKKKK